jgi:hypothetical protein
VINRIKVARYVVIGGVVLTVGAAAGAATKMKRWSAGDACLCTPDTQDAAGFGTVARATGATASYSRGAGGISPSLTSTSAGPLAPYFAASGPGFWNTRAALASGGKAGGVGWLVKTGNVGAYSGSSSHRVAALGGLWRLMGLNRHVTETKAPSVKEAKVSSTKRGSGNGNGSRGPGGSSQTPAQPPLFAGQLTSIPELLGCGPINIPGLGTIGGHVGSGGPKMAATPEPGSIFLLGTGVLGLFGMLRRRALQ